jgi:hypothetical protein
MLRRRQWRDEERMGEEMLQHPSSFVVPWTALVAAEVGDPIEAAPPGQLEPVDPVLLMEERDGVRRPHALCVDRFPYDRPAVDAAELFRRRASFEQLALVMEVLDRTREAPLDSSAVSLLCLRWFGRFMAKQSKQKLEQLEQLWAPLGEDDVLRRAAGMLAPYPIAAALDSRPESATFGELPAAKPAARPFRTNLWLATLTDHRGVV